MGVAEIFSLELPPETPAGASASSSTAGGDELDTGGEMGISGVDFTRRSEASSSSWTTWVASFLGLDGHSRAQWPVLPHRRH
jgi:hypothetical protein